MPKTDVIRSADQSIKIVQEVFLKANQMFLSREVGSIIKNLSERALCGQLMMYLRNELDKTSLKEYHVHLEYNRNGDKLKTIIGEKEKIIPITCDLIIHSQGQIIEQDNLLAIEMKKSTAKPAEKDKDRERLKILTKDSFNDVWSFDGRTLPEHVCRYLLGVYYEINRLNRHVLIEFYKKGELWFDITEKI